MKKEIYPKGLTELEKLRFDFERLFMIPDNSTRHMVISSFIWDKSFCGLKYWKKISKRIGETK